MAYERDDRRYGFGGDRNRFDDRGGRPPRPDYGRDPRGYDYQDRGFMDRAGDEVRSWFGDEDAEALGVDEVAVDHPDCKFVICHIGNPWTTDAAEVIYKNMNVWADLSGLLVGDDGTFASEEGREQVSETAHAVARAIRYSERPNRFLYGTDWPLAPMTAYREFVREAVPAEWHEMVFEETARRLFKLV